MLQEFKKKEKKKVFMEGCLLDTNRTNVVGIFPVLLITIVALNIQMFINR